VRNSCAFKAFKGPQGSASGAGILAGVGLFCKRFHLLEARKTSGTGTGTGTGTGPGDETRGENLQKRLEAGGRPAG